jgi:hypothetical protein
MNKKMRGKRVKKDDDGKNWKSLSLIRFNWEKGGPGSKSEIKIREIMGLFEEYKLDEAGYQSIIDDMINNDCLFQFVQVLNNDGFDCLGLILLQNPSEEELNEIKESDAGDENINSIIQDSEERLKDLIGRSKIITFPNLVFGGKNPDSQAFLSKIEGQGEESQSKIDGQGEASGDSYKVREFNAGDERVDKDEARMTV